MSMVDRIALLLDRLSELNENDPGNEQKRKTAVAHPGTIATLEEGVARQLSPMLRSRFAYCGEWLDAYAGQAWLDLAQIADFRNDPVLIRRIGLRLENFDLTPPATVDAHACAIFAYSPYDTDETYLVWEEGVQEPAIWTYTGGEQKRFSNFESFLSFVTGDHL